MWSFAGNCSPPATPYTVLQPTFPSSGRGWMQSLVHHALQQSGFNKDNKRSQNVPLGGKIFVFTHAHSEGVELEWTFTHELDGNHSLALVEHTERPQLVVRVVREPLANVDAYFRYQSRISEQANATQPAWKAFASQRLRDYPKFHNQWAGMCTRPHVCCMRTTYEQLNEDPGSLLKTLFRTWLGRLPVHVTDQAVAAAVEKFAPIHSKHSRNGSMTGSTHWPQLQLTLPSGSTEWQLQFTLPSGNSFQGFPPELIIAARRAGAQ